MKKLLVTCLLMGSMTVAYAADKATAEATAAEAMAAYEAVDAVGNAWFKKKGSPLKGMKAAMEAGKYDEAIKWATQLKNESMAAMAQYEEQKQQWTMMVPK